VKNAFILYFRLYCIPMKTGNLLGKSAEIAKNNSMSRTSQIYCVWKGSTQTVVASIKFKFENVIA